MGDQPPAVYDVEDKALNARIAWTDDGYDGKYGNLIGYWFEMKLPGKTVPFLGKARVEPIVSRTVAEELEAKGIKPYGMPLSERHKLAKELVAQNGFLLECHEFKGNWKEFALDELRLVRDAFVRLYFTKSRIESIGKSTDMPRPIINGIEVLKINFQPIGWPRELKSTMSTVEVFS
jgi:hypothetical protein